MPRKPIVVIGSINMDLVCRCARMPRPGETVAGQDLLTIPGGKGANQAVAAAKVGAAGDEVHLIGRVGADDFGQRMLVALREHGVRTQGITVTEGSSTGCAMILVDKAGENSIVLSPGANAKVSIEDVNAAADLIAGAAVVILQLEIPLDTVAHAIALCRRAGVKVILDPTPVPAKGLPKPLYQVDVLTPNQSEAEVLLETGAAMGRSKRARRVDAKQLGEELLERGPGVVLLKLGAKGAMIVDNEIQHVKGFKVNVTDTTAAGDAFNGALAVALAEGMELGRAVRFANAAGARACEKFGAQPALPTRMDVESLMEGMH
ncbi:MAG: ribokinase [Phycisphaerales bacterium]|nr:ribokinase [Phycisphaerales bacterium]